MWRKSSTSQQDAVVKAWTADFVFVGQALYHWSTLPPCNGSMIILNVTIIVIILRTTCSEVTWILLFLTYIRYYCDRQEAIDEEQSGVGAPSHGVKIPKICPIGFYCPNGTETAGQYPCNDGTYSNSTGLEMFEQCLPCTEGHYCTAENITAPTGILSVHTIDLISIY